MIMQNNYRIDINVAAHANNINLFSEFKQGNAQAFSLLYDQYVNILFNYGCKLVNDRELLKDCIHDVFVKIYNKRGELNNIMDFKSYLFVSLKNKLCDEIRRKAHLAEKQVEEYHPVAGEDVESDYLAVEKDVFVNGKVSFLLSKLSARQREAVTLYFIEEKEYEDICKIMNINYQSLRNLIHRSLTRLRSIGV